VNATSKFQATCRGLSVTHSMGAVGTSDGDSLVNSFTAILKEVLKERKPLPSSSSVGDIFA